MLDFSRRQIKYDHSTYTWPYPAGNPFTRFYFQFCSPQCKFCYTPLPASEFSLNTFIMDPFTIATGLSGFLSLAIQVTQILREYTETVKSAPTDARNMLAEVDIWGRLERRDVWQIFVCSARRISYHGEAGSGKILSVREDDCIIVILQERRRKWEGKARALNTCRGR